jgi:hypothetical protein
MAIKCKGCGRVLGLPFWFSEATTCNECIARDEATRHLAIQQYHDSVRRALGDGVITPQEWSALEDLRGRFGQDPFSTFRSGLL